MLIIRTEWDSFEQYLASLSASAQKNYKYCEKKNRDLTYSRIEYDRNLVKKFMEIWEGQIVHGEPIRWTFDINHVEKLARKNRLMVFDGGGYALQFIEKKGNYWDCHAPLYDKIDSKRYLAKWMWFNLIRFAIDNKIETLNMGGGLNNWREYIKSRHLYQDQAYKWQYVPEKSKLNPDDEQNYTISGIFNSYLKKL